MDAETGELHPELTPGQREYDVDLARTNIIGELMDLQAGGYFPMESDPVDVGDRIRTQYDLLWTEVTAEEYLPNDQRQYLVSERIRRLNDLGFDVAELRMARTTPVSTSSFSPRWSTRDTTTASSCA